MNQQTQNEMNHPFFFIPSYFKDIVLIGSYEEVAIAERAISRVLSEVIPSSKVTHTLSILLPSVLKNSKETITTQFSFYRDQLKKRFPNVLIYKYDPSPPRKHATVMLIGQWA